MYKTQIVLGLVVLYVRFAHNWELAVAHGDLLDFYTNDTKTNTVCFNSHNLGALAYDEVHNMLLYVDKQSDDDAICGYDISSMESKCFTERNGRNIRGLSFDPATELLFFSDINKRSINWISLKSGSNKNENLLINVYGIPTDIAIDSCRGYVYWINKKLMSIERTRFGESESEIFIDINSINKLEPHSLTIDQQTNNIYWIEPYNSSSYIIMYADLYGTKKHSLIHINFRGLTFTNPSSNRLTVSKTSLFVSKWCSDCKMYVAEMGKTKFTGAKKMFHTQKETFNTVANYKIKEQIQDIKDCDALLSLEQRNSVEPICVHGVKVIGQSLCKCEPGYIGERCDLPICQNYCLQGSCSINNEGLPKCRCNAGYSGERCENTDALYCVNGVKVIGQSRCKCAPGYIGERCDLSICENYCLQGSCSINDEGLPKCRCNAGYSGERCENTDGLYCVNGVKVIGQSRCKCAPGYIGERCDLSICENYCLQGNCSINDEELPECRCNAGYSGKRCEINSCHGYCLNNGVCSLNEEDEPFCECVGGYQGSKCEVFQSVTFTFSNYPAYSAETKPTLIDLLSNVRKNTSNIFFIVDES